MENKEEKTIIILTHVGFDNSPYCSYVHSHAKALKEQGYRVIVFAMINWFPILSNFQKYKKDFMKKQKGQSKRQIIDGIEVIYKKVMSVSNFLYDSPINLNGLFYYWSIKRMIKNINKKEKIVLIDAHTFKQEGYVAYKLKKEYPDIPATITLHGTSFFRNTETSNGRKCIKKIFSKVDYAVCVSHKIQRMVTECGINNTKVIFNGINQHTFEEVNKNDYRYKIITVGALIPRKKHDVTINAIAELVKDYPEMKLTIIGAGEEKQNLQQIVKEKELEKYVEFKEQIANQEVLKLMNKSDIFVLPSIVEGFGIVYAEAMKAKCITIGTKNEGIDGFIKNGENGFLIEPNENEIVQVIKEIYSNKYDLTIMREKAYKDANELTWERNAKFYIELSKS